MHRLISRQKGFTLLELMISMVILAIAFIGILPFFFYSQAQLKEATLTNMAMQLIEEKMERIMYLGGEDIDLIHWQDDPFPGSGTQYTYILPERFMEPCSGYPSNPCGWDDKGTANRNMLMDVVERQEYFFTRFIDIDDPDISASWEDENTFGADPSGGGLPDDGQTIRVTITVTWTIPGGGEHFVRATTHVYGGMT